MAAKRGHEIPTIDVSLITIQVHGETNELALNTASQIQVASQTETQDPVKLIVKGRLIAQKGSSTTITGTQLTLTDNVFNAELVKILQGGKIEYWTSEDHTTTGEVDAGFGLASYTPPVAGSNEKGKIFTLKAYSAIYDAAGICTGYERILYPNCQGIPVAFNAQDGVFRAPEYTINSAPQKGEAPYAIHFIGPDELPQVEEIERR